MVEVRGGLGVNVVGSGRQAGVGGGGGGCGRVLWWWRGGVWVWWSVGLGGGVLVGGGWVGVGVRGKPNQTARTKLYTTQTKALTGVGFVLGVCLVLCGFFGWFVFGVDLCFVGLVGVIVVRDVTAPSHPL